MLICGLIDGIVTDDYSSYNSRQQSCLVHLSMSSFKDTTENTEWWREIRHTCVPHKPTGAVVCCSTSRSVLCSLQIHTSSIQLWDAALGPGRTHGTGEGE